MSRDDDDEMQFLFSFSYKSHVMGQSKGRAGVHYLPWNNSSCSQHICLEV